MKQMTCERGHIYDGAQYAQCPYCRRVPSLGVTQPVQDVEGSSGGPPPPTGGSGVAPTREFQAGGGGSSQKTRAFVIGPAREPGQVSSAEEPMESADSQSFAPVVGWLLCIKGPNRGRDYKLYPEYNYIGRDSTNSINLEGDNRVSRSKHASVFFNPTSIKCEFGLIHHGGTSATYLDGRPVHHAEPLDAFQKIRVGNTTLLFVPSCVPGKFIWPNLIKSEDED